MTIIVQTHIKVLIFVLIFVKTSNAFFLDLTDLVC